MARKLRYNQQTGQLEFVEMNPQSPTQENAPPAQPYQTPTIPNANENTRFMDPLSFDSTSQRGSPVMPNEGTQDQVFRLLLENLQGTRARYNRLGTMTGAKASDLAAAVDPLREQLGQLDASANMLDGLTQQLVGSSLGSTANASMAAVNAARLSDARFGGGGNAAMLASRAATDAAGASSTALSQALVQGRLSEANYRTGILQQRSGVASALSTVLQQQAGLLEDRGKLGVAMESEISSQLGNAMQVYGNLTAGRDQQSFSQKHGLPEIFGLF